MRLHRLPLFDPKSADGKGNHIRGVQVGTKCRCATQSDARHICLCPSLLQSLHSSIDFAAWTTAARVGTLQNHSPASGMLRLTRVLTLRWEFVEGESVFSDSRPFD